MHGGLRPTAQMSGGRPSRVSRHTVRQRMARRSPADFRRPSANPPPGDEERVTLRIDVTWETKTPAPTPH